MVYKPTRHQSLAKSQGRDDPRHIISTASKARVPQPVSSKSRTGSVERRLLAFYTEYRPEKLLEVDDILKRYSGREEELFDALVMKYGPERVGPNYKSRNESSVRRKSKQPVVAVARDNLHSTRSWGDISSLMPIEDRRKVEARALARYLGAPDRDDVEVPISIRFDFPDRDEREGDRDRVNADEALLSSQLKLFTEQAYNEATERVTVVMEKFEKQVADAYEHFLREHHLVDIREEEEVTERDEDEESSFHDDSTIETLDNNILGANGKVVEGSQHDSTKVNKHSMAYASGYMKGYLKGYEEGKKAKKAFWHKKSRE